MKKYINCKKFAVASFLAVCFGVMTIGFSPINVFADSSVNDVEIHTLDIYEGELASSFITEDIGAIGDQGKHGDCWAFGALNTLQINMNKMGYINVESENQFYDFSESAVVKYGMNCYCQDCHSMNVSCDSDGNYTCNDCGGSVIGYTNAEYNNKYEAGGYGTTAINYLISNPILTSEEDWGYNLMFPSFPEPEEYEQYPFQINSVYTSKEHSIEELKRMIVGFGAVFGSHYMFDMNITQNIYVDADNNSYLTYCGESLPLAGGHAICVIGYDDNFSKSNFVVNQENVIEYLESQSVYGADVNFNLALKTLGIPYSDDIHIMNQSNYIDNAIDYIRNMPAEEFKAKYAPKTDGAFLVKNSWGTWEDCTTGCYWLPYDQADDMCLLDEYYAFNSVSEKAVSQTEYSYDELGAWGYLEYSEEDIEENEVGYFGYANVYQFKQNSVIDYVSLSVSASEDYNYKLYYAPVVNNTIIDNQKLLLKEGTESKNNYYTTIYLDEKFVIPNKTGAILVEFDVNEPVKMGIDISDFISVEDGKCKITVVNDNESFILTKDKYEKAYFEDLDEMFNNCIRVGVTQSNDAPLSFGADYTEYNLLKSSNSFANLKEHYYTVGTWENFINAKNVFNSVSTLLDVWQQDVIDTATKNLQTALQDLEYKPANYEKYNLLKQSVQQANYSAGDYSTESYLNYLICLNEFYNVKQDYRINDQLEINVKVSNLNVAIRHLEPKETEPMNMDSWLLIFNLILLVGVFTVTTALLIKLGKNKKF